MSKLWVKLLCFDGGPRVVVSPLGMKRKVLQRNRSMPNLAPRHTSSGRPVHRQHSTIGGDEGKQQMVAQLLQEAVEQEENGDSAKHLEFSSSSNQEYDRYGFQKTYIGDDDDLLTTRANQLQERSEAVDSRLKNVEEATSHYIRWENFVVGLTGKAFLRSKELKVLIRSGVPHDFRNRIWQGCVSLYVSSIREKLGPQYYADLVKRTTTQKFNPAEKQISLDLRRTLPNNRYFEDELGDGVRKLRKVLLAYSLHNPVIGYCQGLNRLVAIALLFLTEEEAFWCLVAIVEHILPQDYYSQTLLAAQVDQRVLKDLVQEKLPRLHTHLEAHGVDLSLFTFNWFLTIFVDNVPPETFLRVWDTFLYEGNKAQLAELDALRTDARSRRQDDEYEDYSEDDLDY